MDIVVVAANWLFLNSVYGIIAIAGLVYVILRAVRKRVPTFPNPVVIAIPIAIIGMLTIPSIPRYQFEKETLAQIRGKNWIRVISQTQWGDLTEPLTLIRAPIGTFFLVLPENPMTGGYREVLIRYGERTRVSLSEPDCTDSTISHSEPDDQGVFRYTADFGRRMTASEFAIYCEYDWSREKEALLAALRKDERVQ